jgi:signal transduction histidine kinase
MFLLTDHAGRRLLSARLGGARTAVVVLMLALIALYGVQLVLERQRELDRASRTLRNLAAVVTEHARQLVEVTDAELSLLVPAVAPDGERRRSVEAISRLLGTVRPAAPHVYEFFVVDESGTVVASSSPEPVARVSLADSESFRHHAAVDSTASFIAEPGLGLVGRATSRQIIRISRRLSHPDGAFGGMVVAAMSIAPLRIFYESIDLGTGGVVTLFRADGLVLVRVPAGGPFGSSIARTAFYREQIAGRPRATFDLVSPLDGVTRLTAFDRDAEQRLLVTVGVPRSEILSDWNARAGIGMLAAVVLLGLLTSVVRADIAAARRREADAAASADRFQRLAAASARIAKGRNTPEVLDVVASEARALIPAHQSVASITVDGALAQAIHGISLSERYAAWRTYSARPDGTGIYRLVCERNESMCLTQTELVAHPAWRGFADQAAHHPPMRGWLASPLTAADGANLGLIQLSDRESGDFTEADQALLEQLAHVAAVSLENVRLSEQTASARDAAEAARIEAEQAKLEIERVFNTTSDAFYRLDAQWRVVFLNPQAETVLQRSREALIGRNLWDLFPRSVGTTLHSEFHTAVRDQVPREFRYLSPTIARWLDYRVFPQDGDLLVYFRDVTEQVELDAQIRQAQKMEAVGQLTGGVAHDFNNLLTVIIGSVDAVAESLEPDHDLQPYAEMAQSAAATAAQLTQRLLAFSRRQALAPAPVDVNDLLQRLDTLMRRTLGEHIETRLVLADDLPFAMVDPSQLENAILNLAINARDAMPAGGTVEITTSHAVPHNSPQDSARDVAAGRYVCISVTDSGMGMTPDVMARAFEPFFTTKDVGRGSGLGLSMVYGFVTQSGGHVDIDSVPGRGTTVTVAVPEADVAPVDTAVECSTRDLPSGTETLAVVEDQLLVRRHVEAVLQSLGYDVRSFETGSELLASLDAGFTPALLVSDVVLPGGMNGPTLAGYVTERLPDARVLFMSCYTEGALDEGLLGAERVHLLHKPFRKGELARTVRALLDEPRPEHKA